MNRFIKRSPWVFHLSLGTCNGCEIEVLTLMTPRFDAERWGVRFVKSPRHADVVLLTGCGTERALKRSKRVLDQIPEDKVVVAVGACACSGGIFKQGHKPPLKADIYVAGCPPKPEAMLEGIMEAVRKCCSKD